MLTAGKVFSFAFLKDKCEHVRRSEYNCIRVRSCVLDCVCVRNISSSDRKWNLRRRLETANVVPQSQLDMVARFAWQREYVTVRARPALSRAGSGNEAFGAG